MNRRVTTYKTGDIVCVTENVDPLQSQFLKLKSGTVLVVESMTENPKILRCRCNQTNQVGLVQTQHTVKRCDLTIATQPWFWGKISREYATEILKNTVPGSFLVRESFTTETQVLCVNTPENNVKHFLIKQLEDGLYTLGETPVFNSVMELVHFHQENTGNLAFYLGNGVDRNTTSGFNRDSLEETLKKAGWWFNYNTLILGRVLGKGEFGEVFEVTHKETKKAAKVMKVRSGDLNDFLSEALVMSQLYHPNLVEMHGVSIHEDRLVLLMELCKKGSLYKYLTCQGRQVVTHNIIKRLCIEICLGMKYLESKGIIHRDLAARNVMLTESITAKITDFGLAMATYQEARSQSLPVRWTAPEALKYKIFSSKSDVWSFGVLLWECYSYGKLPYSHESNDVVSDCIIGGRKLQPPEDCPKEMASLMLSCWKSDPQKRPTFVDLFTKLEI